MKKLMILLGISTILSAQLFINEIDYDQPSTDASEFIELAGPSGSYSNVNLILINGNNNSGYGSYNLGTVSLNDEGQGYGFYVIGTSSIPNVDYTSGFPATNAIQNGNPDGVELWVNGQLVDAVSYAGSMADSEGGIMEEATPNDSDDEYWEGGEGLSIGRIGVNESPWSVMTNSPGSINSNQVLDPGADFPPNAIAGEDIVATPGDIVTLDGSLSNDTDGEIVDFYWEQVGGSDVTLSSYSEAVVTFEVPNVSATTIWSFELTVEDNAGNTSTDEIHVTAYILSQISIYEIQENYSTYENQMVNVVGVVTIGDDLLYPGNTKFYIQDDSGRGIQIFNSPEIEETYVRGDYIEVIGTVEKYNDDVEITNPAITLLGSNYDLPEAVDVTGSESLTMNGTWGTTSGTLTDFWDSDYGFLKMTITTNDGIEIAGMFWNSAVPPADLAQYADMVGQEITATGAISFYNGDIQLTCGYASDVSDNTDPTLPVAVAGADQVVSPGSVVTIDGSASYDSNGSIIAFEWVQIGGTPVMLDDEEEPATFFTAPDESDVITFRLTVWDNDINESTDEVSITVIGETTIYDIQFTDEQGEYCFETPMTGQSVSTTGIVTAVKPGDYPNFFLQDPSLDSWAGIFVYDTSVNPQVGDALSINATVNEYYSYTQLLDVTGFEVTSSGNDVAPTILSTGEMGISCSADAEQYESMLIQFENVTLESIDEFGNWYINDGSGSAMVYDYYYDDGEEHTFTDGDYPELPTAEVGDVFECIAGVVSYSYSEFKISPRDFNDFSCSVEECTPTGDVNIDGIVNVLDIVMVVNHIVDISSITDSDALCNADYNSDGIINVLDIISIVNIIIG